MGGCQTRVAPQLCSEDVARLITQLKTAVTIKSPHGRLSSLLYEDEVEHLYQEHGDMLPAGTRRQFRYEKQTVQTSEARSMLLFGLVLHDYVFALCRRRGVVPKRFVFEKCLSEAFCILTKIATIPIKFSLAKRIALWAYEELHGHELVSINIE